MEMYFIVRAIFLFFSIFIFFEYGLAFAVRCIHLRKLGKKSKGKLVLTYDDGPSSRLEKRLLELFNSHQVRATFFLNAKNAKQSPERCDELRNAGQEIGYHCYEHFNPYKKMFWNILKDFIKAHNIVKEWLSSSKVFRFPFGKYTMSALIMLKCLGVRTAYWTIDSGDSFPEIPHPNEVVDRFLRDEGGVVLMHSYDRIPQAVYKEDYVVELTDLLIKKAKERSWQICSFSEMLDISEKQRI